MQGRITTGGRRCAPSGRLQLRNSILHFGHLRAHLLDLALQIGDRGILIGGLRQSPSGGY